MTSKPTFPYKIFQSYPIVNLLVLVVELAYVERGKTRMLLEYPQRFESYGAIRVHEIARVIELDSLGYRGHRGAYSVDYHTLENYSAQTAIVVPAKNEDLLTLEGVLSAIPHSSPIILVSASSRSPVDRYKHEVDLVRSLHAATRRAIVIVHQHDPVWSDALAGTPLESMIDDSTGTVRKGKGEGMLLGVLIAAALGTRYVGFIDSDNYIPGSAHEYSWIYYAGFSLSESPYSMVRIKWPFKGKLAAGDIYLRKRGRVSMITNTVLNYALTVQRKVETDIIQTANSGEHALSVNLALRMKWAGGFAVEPYQLTHLFEACFLGLGEGECPALPEGVTIYQMESRNPHIHAERGEEHIVGMIASSLGTIYHSKLATPRVVERINKILADYGWNSEPPKPRTYDPTGIDPEKVFATLASYSNEVHILEAR